MLRSMAACTSQGQAGRHAVWIDLDGVQPFRFQKDLVPVLLRKAHHLVLDGRAVAGAHPFDDPGVQRRAVGAGADDVDGLLGWCR